MSKVFRISILLFFTMTLILTSCWLSNPKDNPYVPEQVVVSLNKTDTTIMLGGTEQLSATISPMDAANQNVNWTSNDETKAIVSSSGLVTAKSVGTAAITATTAVGSKTDTCIVTVTPAGIAEWLEDDLNRPIVTSATASTYTFEWPAITGAVKYEIRKCTNWNPLQTTYIAETTTTSYICSDLNIGYYISARNSSGVEICGRIVLGYYSVIASGVQQIQSGTVIDNFDDGVISNAYYKYIEPGGDAGDLVESSGYMEFNETVTDREPLLIMKYNVNSKQYISIRYKNYHHRASDYYGTQLVIVNSNNSLHSFGVKFCSHYNFTPYQFGTVINIDYANIDYNNYETIINQFSPTELFDQWIDGRVVIDRTEKSVRVYINGVQSGSDYTMPINWNIGNELIFVWYHGGWWTGHMSRIDDLEIKSADTLSELGL